MESHVVVNLLQKIVTKTLRVFFSPWKMLTISCIIYEVIIRQRPQNGKTIRNTTLFKYLTTTKRVSDFMAYKYKKDDMPIRDVDFQFVTDYEVYLKSVCECGHNSTVKHLRYLKQVETNALKNRYIATTLLMIIH